MQNKKENGWFGRSLENYKGMHHKTAQSKGLVKELENCNTLTQARKLLFGYKKGNTK